MNEKQKQNAKNYENHIYGKQANRITIPLMDNSHIISATKTFKQLAEELDQISKLRLPVHRKVFMAKFECYKAHRFLLESADESELPGNYVHDFRRIK
tara:strand:+ start:760 stop:1053 length:294 start_codon:yes stop_codon:yes gene_type:complete